MHYFFRSPEQFAAGIEAGEFLEHAGFLGRSYGTPRAPVEQALAAGRDVLFDIEWQGHRLLKAAMPEDVVGIFLLPPSLAELERRLRGRGTDPEDEIARRMVASRTEMAHWDEFDHVLVNEDFAATVAAARAILHAARTRRAPAALARGFRRRAAARLDAGRPRGRRAGLHHHRPGLADGAAALPGRRPASRR